ncbi:MAG: AsmA family protein [Gammaproteobacteria bacterium]|nr:AsmA family protein [Gammaproteobacteria bacterium]
MKRFFKIVFILLGSVLALVLLAAILLPFVVDPNDHKQRIIALAKEQTGRDFTIEGDIQLSVFPWLGFDLGRITMGSPPGFKEPLFASVDSAQARVKLAPLFSKEVKMGTISLQGLTLFLTRKQDGSTNWEDLTAQQAKKAKKDKKSSTPAPVFAIDGLDIRNTQVVWNDEISGERYKISELNLKTGSAALGQPIDTALDFKMKSNNSEITGGKLELSAQITAGPALKHFRAADLRLTLEAQGKAMPGGEQSLKLAARQIDFDPENLAVEALSLQTLGLDLNAAFTAENFSLPSVSGELKLAEFNPRDLLKRLGQTPPALPEPGMLTKASLETRLTGSWNETISLKDFVLRVDDNYLKIPQLHFDPKRQNLALETLELYVLGISMNAGLNVDKLFAGPDFSGEIKVAEFNPQMLLKRLGQTPPALPEPGMLTKASLETRLTGSWNETISLKDFILRVDDNYLKVPQLHLDPKRHNLALETLELYVLGISINAGLHVDKLFAGPDFSGEIKVAEFNPQMLLMHLGQSPSTLLPVPELLTRASLETRISGSLDKGISLNNLILRIDDGWLKTPALRFNPAQQTLDLKNLEVKALGAALNADLKVEKLLTQQRTYSGRLNVTEFNLQDLLKRLGQPPVLTSDPKVLQQLALNTKLSGGMDSLMLKDLSLRLDDSRLNGDLSVLRFTGPSLRFYLALDALNADRYLPPKKDGDSKPTTPSSPQKSPLPLDMLRALDMNGIVQAGHLQVANIKMDDIKLTVSAKNGLLKVTPQARLYEGRYQGNLGLDARENTPLLSMDEKLTGVQAGPLLDDLQNNQGKISGKGVLAAKLHMDASSSDTIKKTLNGLIRFSFRNGALKGVNLGNSIRKARALIKNQPPPPENQVLKTDFSELHGSFKVQNGVLNNEDLALNSPFLRVKGQSKLTLVTNEMRTRLNVSIVDTTTGQDGKKLAGLRGITIPVEITGQPGAPRVKVDTKAMLKAEAKRQLLKYEDKIQNKLQDKLKRLFR